MEGPMDEDVEEADKEMDVGKAPLTRDLVPEQALAPPAILPAMAGIWGGGQGDQVAGQGPATCLRARGKVPAVQVE